MSETIRYIETERIFAHPENPRRDVGDVTELADSIRAQGILQNLTVIPWDEVHEEPAPVPDAVVVVIGHRRLAAAKLAGLEKLPCFPTHMDRKTQISTMLLENMQRADLTIPEQAAGFQLMMDLGATVEEISEQTGFAARTVQRRLQIAKLPKDLLQKSWEKGGCTLEEYAKIAALKSKRAQDHVLKNVGSDNFSWVLRQAINDERREENRKTVLKFLNKVGFSIYSGKDYSPQYTCIRVHDFDLNSKTDPTKGVSLPKKTEGLFYYDTVSYIYLLKERPKEKNEKQKISEKEKAANEQRRALLEVCRAMRESRAAFIAGYTQHVKHEELIWRWLLHFALVSKLDYTRVNENVLKQAAGPEPDGVQWQKHVFGWAWTATEAPLVAAYALAGDGETDSEILKPYAPGYCERAPAFQKNEQLEELYRFLEQLGYTVSDEERQMLDGTHALYGKREEKKDAAEKS